MFFIDNLVIFYGVLNNVKNVLLFFDSILNLTLYKIFSWVSNNIFRKFGEIFTNNEIILIFGKEVDIIKLDLFLIVFNAGYSFQKDFIDFLITQISYNLCIFRVTNFCTNLIQIKRIFLFFIRLTTINGFR